MSDKYIQLEELILKEIDGTCNQEEFARLQAYLQDDVECLAYYLEFVSMCAGMLRPGEVGVLSESVYGYGDVRLSELWAALSQEERTAETIILENQGSVKSVPVDRKAVVREHHKTSRWPIYVTISLLAALIVMVAYVVTHPRGGQFEVATLSDSYRAVWSDKEGIVPGKRLYTKSLMYLTEGFAEITFDNHAKIILQSPAEFYIENENQLFLYSGKLTAHVPESAIGFVVRSEGTSVVDYGTEFGVTTDGRGQTEVHVFDGKVELRSGDSPVCFDDTIRLVKGQASRAVKGVLSKEVTAAQPTSYTLCLPKANRLAQAGKYLDLSDIVAGGNGFGTAEEYIGVDPTSGQVVSKLLLGYRQFRSGQYHLVPDNICVDGVFVPLGESPEIITSQGHIFQECPHTDGRCWAEIAKGPIRAGVHDDDDVCPLQLGDIQYGTLMHPAILMHANTGITFDLKAIRKMVPGATIRAFSAIGGLSDSLKENDDTKAELWVLVNGQVSKSVRLSYMSAETSHADFYIELSDNDRFLTLIATDGLDGNMRDWTYFGDPILEIGVSGQ